MRLVSLALLFATPAAAEGLVITSESNIAIGANDVGVYEGFSAVGHFNLGASFRNVRMQGELDLGWWFSDLPPELPPEDNRKLSGSVFRLGWATRYYWMNLDVAKPGKQAPQRLRLYVEGGLGRQWIAAKHAVDGSGFAVARNDVVFGFGMAQEADVGPILLGGHFGLRIHVADAPQPNAHFVACRGACDEARAVRAHDVALFFVIGLVVGKPLGKQ